MQAYNFAPSAQSYTYYGPRGSAQAVINPPTQPDQQLNGNPVPSRNHYPPALFDGYTEARNDARTHSTPSWTPRSSSSSKPAPLVAAYDNSQNLSSLDLPRTYSQPDVTSRKRPRLDSSVIFPTTFPDQDRQGQGQEQIHRQRPSSLAFNMDASYSFGLGGQSELSSQHVSPSMTTAPDGVISRASTSPEKGDMAKMMGQQQAQPTWLGGSVDSPHQAADAPSNHGQDTRRQSSMSSGRAPGSKSLTDKVEPPTAPQTATPADREMRATAKSKFSDEEDRRLVELKEQKDLTWKQIAEHFPGRTSGTLQVRYCTKLKIKSSDWPEDLVLRLKTAIKEYEDERWKAIAAQVGGSFTDITCRDKAVELKLVTLRHGTWVRTKKATKRKVVEPRHDSPGLPPA